MTTDWDSGFDPPDGPESAARNAPSDPPKALATYRATVGLDLERSEFVYDTNASTTSIRTAGSVAPGWLTQWPPVELQVNDARDASAEGIVLAKMVALFDFASEIDERSPEAILRAVDRRWPRVAAARNQRADAKSVFERVEVTAWLREDGTADWSYVRADERGEPLPMASEAGLKRGELEIFVQNLVRVDLRQRMAAAVG
jgi:hypothetical protein